MNKDELHHVLQADASLTGEDQFVVIGSQAIVWQVPGVPDEMVTSMEVDIYPRNALKLADEIDGTSARGHGSTRRTGTGRTVSGQRRRSLPPTGKSALCQSSYRASSTRTAI